MHIYSNDSYKKKQAEFVEKNFMKDLSKVFSKKSNRVIKNYIYYCEPIKIN